MRKSKIGPVRVLDELNIAVPSQVWLRQLEEKGNIARIKGRALGNDAIAQFMRNLDNSDYFDSVDLVESQQMYYSKRTGKVTPQPDIDNIRHSSPDFGRESRATKDTAVLRDGVYQSGAPAAPKNAPGTSLKDRSKLIEDHLVKIKEFVLSAKVNYAGRLIPEEGSGSDDQKGKIALNKQD